MQVSTFYQFLSQPKTSLPGKGYPLGGIQKLPIQLSTHPVSETILRQSWRNTSDHQGPGPNLPNNLDLGTDQFYLLLIKKLLVIIAPPGDIILCTAKIIRQCQKGLTCLNYTAHVPTDSMQQSCILYLGCKMMSMHKVIQSELVFESALPALQR